MHVAITNWFAEIWPCIWVSYSGVSDQSWGQHNELPILLCGVCFLLDPHHMVPMRICASMNGQSLTKKSHVSHFSVLSIIELEPRQCAHHMRSVLGWIVRVSAGKSPKWLAQNFQPLRGSISRFLIVTDATPNDKSRFLIVTEGCVIVLHKDFVTMIWRWIRRDKHQVQNYIAHNFFIYRH
jgi:hypothetical protein